MLSTQVLRYLQLFVFVFFLVNNNHLLIAYIYNYIYNTTRI